MDVKEFVERLRDGERYFIDLEFEDGADIIDYVPSINEILRSSVREGNPLVLDGCRFQRVKADNIYLESLNSIWDSEKRLYFVDCSMRNSILCRSNLRNSDFSKSDLSFSNLSESNLENATMVKVEMRGAKLRKANLENADLTGASLEEADLCEAILHGSIFANANLHKASLRGSELFKTDFRGADLSEADLACSCGSADFSDAIIDNAKIGEVEWMHSIFERASLRKAEFSKASLYKMDFSDSILRGARFLNSYMRHITFENSDMKRSKLCGSELCLVDFSETDLRGSDFRGSILRGCFFFRTDLRGVKGLEDVKGLENSLFIDVVVDERVKDVIEERTKTHFSFTMGD